eukprot:TRINITY_DN33994_c0_g1_i1.p1 TRINITY_DN33994_c0_g1~~TRINITY_DN33994_c0_g1_i1.p1  ORF type:complete len:749 (+),score=178.28 TRINITY_DN33994_c0_g1_i1:166-2412(+)
MAAFVPSLDLTTPQAPLVAFPSSSRISPRVSVQSAGRRVAEDRTHGGDWQHQRLAAGCVVALPLIARAAKRSGKTGRRLRRAIARRAASAYPDGRYDWQAAASYFQGRPIQVLGRTAELVTAFGGFGVKWLLDRQTGQEAAQERNRAKELTDIITQVGPTFIKIGQALSIRADLLSPAYLEALTELQDRVPEFSSQEATRIMERELGKPVDQVFDTISPEPIASASLGQVYKAKAIDGPEVAVKVQRPGVEEVIALDLFLLRAGSGPLMAFLELVAPVNTDLIGLVDAWGEGFVGELDYLQEAKNTKDFQEAIQSTPLGGAVCSPPVVDRLTTPKVLVTEWINGERLENSEASDITTLCSVAMNTYLTMLLQTGVLHADPHPGNLLRMPDGKLCILDWGLVTSLDEDLQFTFIEHVAHLVSRDYGKVPSDLTKLGFVPEGSEEAILQSEVVDVLANVYGQWTDGGGASNIDVGAYMNELQTLGSKYGNIFRVPPYFFYIARAFAVLEGIGLTNNPTYSIVQECLPYISQRLLTDTSPRAAGALQTYVYGEGKERADRQLDVSKVEYLADGFSSYSSATNGLTASAAPAEDVGRLVTQLAELLLGEGDESGRPTPLQEIALDELSKVLGARARSAFASLGLLRRADDASASSSNSPTNGNSRWTAVTPDASDEVALRGAERLATLAQPQVDQLIASFRALDTQEQARVAREVLSRLWDFRAGAVRNGQRLVRKLVSQGLRRLSSDLLRR